MKHVCFVVSLSAVSLWAQSPTINDLPSREFGQLRLNTGGNITSIAPNLVEGRELNAPRSLAFDTSVSPPIIYVADTGNNRVLAWRNPAGLNRGNFADKVIGQRDMFSTLFLGPQTSLSTGLSVPTSVAVDARGNLYVLDAANNRILRYPQPFNQTGDLLTVDLVLGQRTTSSGRLPNQGTGVPSASTLAFTDGGGIQSATLAFDPQGNLWVADSNNNRVLRYNATDLARSPSPLELAADQVLGQNGLFNTKSLPPDNPSLPTYRNMQAIDTPSEIAIDALGRMYITDRRARVLYYATLSNFAQADRIIGIPRSVQGQTVTFPNSFNVAAYAATSGGFFQAVAPPEGIIIAPDNSPLIVDSGDHRIMRFGTPNTWAAATDTAPSPEALSVIGQANFTSGKMNRGNPLGPDNTSFASPVSGKFLNNELWIADTGNNRVISMPQSGSFTFPGANRVLGQIDFIYNSPNLVEGREMWVGNGNNLGGAVVIDRTSNPPRLYIADTFNNRILGFADARKVGVDSRTDLTTAYKADLVIGQPDLLHTGSNYPSGDSAQPSESGLWLPTGLAVDANGNLYVADRGNGRVLRFPSPFQQPAGGVQKATLVIGQRDFTSPPITDVGPSSLNAPYGLALLSNGSLAVSDLNHNRVLIYRKPAGGDFTNSPAASIVLGQLDFIGTAAGSGLGQLRAPHHIAVDSSDRLYVADSSNNRLLVFTNVSTTSNGATAAFQLGNLTFPTGVTVSQSSGEIWVANTNSNQIARLPEFQQLQLDPSQTYPAIPSSTPLAVALDSFDNLVAVEGLNRTTFYFAKLVSQHAANYNVRPLAPGQLAYLYRLGKPFAFTAADGTAQNPWPTTLADLQVTVNGIPAPIFHVNPDRIDFQVPITAPSAGPAEFIVQRASTGEILAAVTNAMAVSNPGFFTLGPGGTGQAAATHPDGSINGPSNQVARGTGIITFYLTGQGNISGAPQDGAVPVGAIPTSVKPTIVVATCGGRIPDGNIEYSGLGAFAGGWQINLRVPDACAPSNNSIIGLSYNDVQSNIGFNSNVSVTFAVK